MSKDVTIKAPTAAMFVAVPVPGMTPPSPEELCQAQAVQLRAQAEELRQLHITMGTIANATVALIHMLQEKTGAKVITIPRDLKFRLDGAQVQVATNGDGDLIASYVDAPMPQFQGRPDDG